MKKPVAESSREIFERNTEGTSNKKRERWETVKKACDYHEEIGRTINPNRVAKYIATQLKSQPGKVETLYRTDYGLYVSARANEQVLPEDAGKKPTSLERSSFEYLMKTMEKEDLAKNLEFALGKISDQGQKLRRLKTDILKLEIDPRRILPGIASSLPGEDSAKAVEDFKEFASFLYRNGARFTSLHVYFLDENGDVDNSLNNEILVGRLAEACGMEVEEFVRFTEEGSDE